MIFPWQEKNWHRLQQQKNSNRFPHALLIAGAKGIGKYEFAKELIQQLLCLENHKQKICGNCQGCHLYKAGNHPDLLTITGIENATTIKIEQIREAIDFMQSTAFLGGYKIVFLYMAEWLNINASNALLKILEEPPIGNKLFVLLTENPRLLLPTIQSRVQKLLMPLPEKSQAIAFLQQETKQAEVELALQLAQGSPLIAKEILMEEKGKDFFAFKNDVSTLNLQNLLPVAKKWANQTLGDLLNWFAMIVHEDMLQSSSKSEKINLCATQDVLLEYQKALRAKVAVNQQMMLERLFYSIAKENLC